MSDACDELIGQQWHNEYNEHEMLREIFRDVWLKRYSKMFDRIFAELTESEDQNKSAELSTKLAKIKDNHLKEYSSIIDKRVNEELQKLLQCSAESGQSSALASDDQFGVRLVTAVLPVKRQYSTQLTTVEQTECDRHESTVERSHDVRNQAVDQFNAFKQLSKSLQKKVTSIITELERDINAEEIMLLQ